MSNTKIKVVFLGNPTISASALKSIILNDRFDVIAVVTSPDKSIGRSHSVKKQTPVAALAESNGIKIIKTDSINTDINELINLGSFDILLTAAFGQMLSDEVLSLPSFKSLNIHGSLLPEGRGGAPLHWAIINGKKTTGVSVMEMSSEMDAGNYYTQDIIEISETETFDSLYEKMSIMFEEIVAERLISIIEGKIEPIIQDESKVSKWLNISKQDSMINFNLDSKHVYDQIRGLFSKPGAWCEFNGKKFKVNKSEINNEPLVTQYEPGTIIEVNQKGILISAGNNTSIYLENITLSGKTATKVSDLLNGSLDFLNN